MSLVTKERKRETFKLLQGGRQGWTGAFLLLLAGNSHLALDGLHPRLHVAPGPPLPGRHSGFLCWSKTHPKADFAIFFEKVVIVVKPSTALVQLAKFVLTVILGELIVIVITTCVSRPPHMFFSGCFPNIGEPPFT